MSRPSEYWSEELAHSSGKPDANLAANALQLGGIDAEDFATKKYVQDFHNNKEQLLKEYIDSQDLAKLQEAKDYVDTMIRNQDFSMFAKVTDLQTLSQTLNAKIEACKTECQQEMNTRINAVVNDVNNNFDDVNGAISQLNSKTNELFTSVSNGKDLVADAITDKGIHTSATDSYSTMAQNIRNIETSGGGDYDENYVNTSDGNAVENDIALGKIAYAKGQKIIGTHEDLDTSDATAKDYEIRLGKTAYVNGEKITGTFETREYPTIGTDTSNATATPADILAGKTAYARGQLITGILQNMDVEEIYGVDQASNMRVNNFSTFNKDPFTEDEISSRSYISYTKDGEFCVSVTKLNNANTQYVESYAVTDDGLAINQTTSIFGDTVTKKYRYSLSDLGIGNTEIIQDLKISKYGTHTYLYILTKTDSRNDAYIYVYDYETHDEGNIKTEYNTNYKYKIKMDLGYISLSYSCAQIICFNQTDKYIYIIFIDQNVSPDQNYIVIKLEQLSNDFIKTVYTGPTADYGGSNYKQIIVSDDDKYILLGTDGGRTQYGDTFNSSSYVPFIYNKIEDGNYSPCLGFAPNGLSIDNYYIDSVSNEFIGTNSSTSKLNKYSFSLNNYDVPELTLNKEVTINYPQAFSSATYKGFGIIDKVGDKLLVQMIYGWGTVINGNPRYKAIGTIDISNIDNETELSISEVIYTPTSTVRYMFDFMPFSKSDKSRFILHPIQDYAKDAIVVLFDIISRKLIGVRYKGQSFYNYLPNYTEETS